MKRLSAVLVVLMVSQTLFAKVKETRPVVAADAVTAEAPATDLVTQALTLHQRTYNACLLEQGAKPPTLPSPDLFKNVHSAMDLVGTDANTH